MLAGCTTESNPLGLKIKMIEMQNERKERLTIKFNLLKLYNNIRYVV
jgi:hypothetical protein